MPRILAVAAIIITSLASAPLHSQGGAHRDCLRVQGLPAHDFGTMSQTATSEFTFVLTNTCSDTLRIEGAKTSCGCTAAVVSEKVVPPGGPLRIHVRYTPTTGSTGLVTKSVGVYEQGNPQPVAEMTISATIRADLIVSPSMGHFGDGIIGRPMTARTTLTNASDRTVTVEVVVNTMSVYATEVGSADMSNVSSLKDVEVEPKDITLRPGEKREVRVTVHPAAAGKLYGALEFRSSTSRIFLSLSGQVLDPADPRAQSLEADSARSQQRSITPSASPSRRAAARKAAPVRKTGPTRNAAPGPSK